MRLTLFTWLFFVGCVGHLFAQATVVVRDSASLEPLQGATVIANNGSFITDEFGLVRFQISAPQNVEVRFLGYMSQSRKISPNQQLVFLMAPTVKKLKEVILEEQRPNVFPLGNVDEIKSIDQIQFTSISPSERLNAVSGMKFEERAVGSYRIAIRGSALRAPFGVRNVKLYWSGYPLTAPDGTTALNILDVSNFGDIQIFKGPSGSKFGAGNGGAVIIENSNLPSEGVEVEASIGSYDMTNLRLSGLKRFDQLSVNASIVNKQTNGYREHNALKRTVANIETRFGYSQYDTLGLDILFSDLAYEIPGGLTIEQFQQNPRQERIGSKEKNSSVDHQQWFFGLNNTHRFGNYFQWKGNYYFKTYKFENPFILDYKAEQGNEFGTRMILNGKFNLGRSIFSAEIGTEYQYGETEARNFENNEAQTGALRFEDELRLSQLLLFQELQLKTPGDWSFTLGLSENFGSQDINRLKDNLGGQEGRLIYDFGPVFIPKFEISKSLNSHVSLSGTFSKGFSPPTIDELRTNEGSLNVDLKPENGLNYELSVQFYTDHFRSKFNLFYLKLEETISTYSNADGVVLFRNAGATDQKGLEISLRNDIVKDGKQFISDLWWQLNYTGHYFRFAEYDVSGGDFSGNQLTGVAPHIVFGQLGLSLNNALDFFLKYRYEDQIPLNDANSVFQDRYTVLGFKMNYQTAFFNLGQLHCYFGVNNIFNKQYSLGPDLNAFGQRYYQPANGRNFYIGFKWSTSK